MSNDRLPNWIEVLRLRDEVVAGRGHADALQMSLHAAVYKTEDVPYQDARYWGEITEPAPNLVGFMADIARRLGTNADTTALYRLDQGMGGGKSHALVGLYHLANDPQGFFESDIGKQVAFEAKRRAGIELDGLDATRVVALTADHFTPAVASETFGPARTLHERFLWALFDAHASQANRDAYELHRSAGADKAAIKEALRAVGRPVLVLLDELMDYALALAGTGDRAFIDSEKVFLNSLLDAVDDLPRVAMVTVLISTDKDEAGYEGPAGDFRSYIGARLERNGTTLSVNEPQDFGAIIRRRIFQLPERPLPIEQVAQVWREGIDTDDGWRSQVFERLPAGRQLAGIDERLERSYPFHPDLLDLVEHDWVRYSGFQQVRSTVAIFSGAVFDWLERYRSNSDSAWVPPLIGVGDLPLPTVADQVLNSGILRGNDRAITALRQVAQTDVVSVDGRHGRAAEIDERIAGDGVSNPLMANPAVRMATALWLYSVANRGQRAGATKPEMLASVYHPDPLLPYARAEEIFNALTDEEGGLGALDIIDGGGGNTPTRYALSTRKNLRMFHRNAKSRTGPAEYGPLLWERVKKLAAKGSAFQKVFTIEAPSRDSEIDMTETFGDVDESRCNRLVILDPRRWTLLNGRDSVIRREIGELLGVEGDLAPSFASSCVVVVVNTQRRDAVNKRAREAAAWRIALRDIDPDSELAEQAQREHRSALDHLDAELKRAFQHYCFLDRSNGTARVLFQKIGEDGQTALSGADVWRRLYTEGRAAGPEGVSGVYLQTLLDLDERHYTLAEVTNAFWADPNFPLVANVDAARRAIFDALRTEGKRQWAVVSGDGDALHFGEPDELPIGSNKHYLRYARELAIGDDDSAEESPQPPGPGPDGGFDGDSPEPEDGKQVVYVAHTLRLPTMSMTDPEHRQQVANLLARIGQSVDSANDTDVQLFEVTLRINAAQGDLEEVKQYAEAIGADWGEEEDLI